MQALDGYKACHTIPRVKMEVHSPTSIPRSLSPDHDGQYTTYSPILSNSSPSSPPSFSSSPSNHRLKREHDYDYDYVNITPLKIMDPFGYEASADSWNTFLYNHTDVTEQQQQLQQQQQQLLFNEQDDMDAFTIFPTSYGVSQGNPNQVGMISHHQQQQQQWDMNNQAPQAHLQYPTHHHHAAQAYYPPSGSNLMPMSPMSAHHHHHQHQQQQQQQQHQRHQQHQQQQQQQGWSTSIPPQYTHGRIQHQHTPSPPEHLAFAPIVPSSSHGRGRGNSGLNDDSSDNEPPSSQPTLSTRYSTALSWLTRTSPQLTPSQITIAHTILRSPWWATETAEPELLANDELVVKGLIATPGGSRFRAFLDEERGWRCLFDHDGVVCGHGKGRMERALGTVRGFFVYKPVVCTGACGTRCEQRFVSVEQCQKHVQKKRSGRVACSECGTSILPANMSRHRRACHAAEA